MKIPDNTVYIYTLALRLTQTLNSFFTLLYKQANLCFLYLYVLGTITMGIPPWEYPLPPSTIAMGSPPHYSSRHRHPPAYIMVIQTQ